MKPLNRSVSLTQQVFKALVVAFVAGYATSSYALEVNLATMIANLSTAIPNFMRLVTALAYVMGMFFVCKGLVELKKHGESRSGGSHHDLTGALIWMGVGGALLYLPSSVQAGMSTFWNNPTPYAYQTDVVDSWSELIDDIFMIVQLIGTIAFIRGLVGLTHLSGGHGGGGGQGGFGKAMAHMVGGILCINIYQFVQAVKYTLTLGQ